jgi:hypothetical protein
MKWMRLRYQPVGSDVWKTLSRLWSYVEDKGLMRARVFVYDDLSTLQRELTKPLMFAMSAADSLSPPEIDVVDRLISHLAGRFNVQRHPGRGCGFVVDIHQWSMPGRYRAGDEVRLGSRFFGPGDAIADLETISAQLAAGDVSNEDVNLEGVSDLEMSINVMAHLERHWSVRRPERREQRERASSSMSVILGYAKVLERIADNDNSVTGDVDGAESWGLDNESEAGYGALVAMERGEQLDIGELIGIRPSDRRVWAVGVIRRLAAQDAARRYVGIELLARGVQAVVLNDANSGEHIATGLLLLSQTGDSADHEEIRLLLPGRSFSAERAFEMIVHNKSYLLQPLIVIETGNNYEVGRFQIVDRAA